MLQLKRSLKRLSSGLKMVLVACTGHFRELVQHAKKLHTTGVRLFLECQNVFGVHDYIHTIRCLKLLFAV